MKIEWVSMGIFHFKQVCLTQNPKRFFLISLEVLIDYQNLWISTALQEFESA